jgi:hypothetical protein
MLLAALLDTEKQELMARYQRAWKSGDAEALHNAIMCHLRDYPS